MNLGGPVWHASAAGIGRRLSERELRRVAFRHLAGVGDRSREWVEWTGRAFHLRRRLTAGEQASVGEAIDLRGTAEASLRFEAAKAVMPKAMHEFAADEIKGVCPT